MKKNHLLFLVLITSCLIYSSALSQKNEWVEQVLIANGGRFETSPPFQDYVTVQSYDPLSQSSIFFNTIYTQSVQDILIADGFAYVAAQDSIVKYDLNTHQRVVAVADSGLSRLGMYGDRLIVTKQSPVSRFYVEILNSTNLALLAFVQNISGDCAGVFATKDSVYVAVNGGWLGSTGKLAVINPTTWTLSREVNFGPQAIGIADLFEYNGILRTVNRSPFGAGQVGSFTSYNLYNQTFVNTVVPVSVGAGLGNLDNILYVVMNEGLGSFDLNTNQIVDTTIVPDPGSANHIFITSGAVDYDNDKLYINIGDRLSFGICLVTSTDGDSLTSFFTGKSADAIELDYRTPVGTPQIDLASTLRLYPNPVEGQLNISYSGSGTIRNIRIINLTGQTVFQTNHSSDVKSFQLDCSAFPQGIYFVSVTTDSGTVTKKFVRK